MLTSEDGYILKIFRIPNGRTTPEGPRIPIILHHGFIADGFEWILNSVDKALGKIFRVLRIMNVLSNLLHFQGIV